MTATSQPRARSGVAWIAAVTFLVIMGLGLVPPALPQFASHYALGTSEVALTLTAFAFGRLLFSLPGGLIADRFGFKRVALVGCAVTAVSAAYAAALPTFWGLVAAQAAQGMGSALYTTAALAAILSEAPKERVGQVTALYQGVVLVGMSAAPAIGGTAVQLLGIAGPFVVYTVGASAAFAISVWKLPSRGDAPVGDPAGDVAAPRRRGPMYGELFRHPSVVLALIVSFMTLWVVAGVRNTMIPLFAETALGFGPAATGWLLTGAALANVAVLRHAGRAIDRGRRPVLVASTVGMGISVAALAAATTPWLLLAATLLLGVTKGYAGVVPITIVVDVADRRIQGAAIGLQRTASGIGLTVGPVTAGLLIEGLGYPLTFVGCGIILAVTAALALRMPETRVAARPLGR